MTESTDTPARAPFLRRVVLKNYKSIAAAAVDLHPLTFLVGPNGSGKSNFLDALRFVNDSLRNSLDHALRERGGINEVRRRSGGHPTNFAIRCDFNLPGSSGHYAFEIAARPQGTFEVRTEQCVVEGQTNARYLVRGGVVQAAESSDARGVVFPPAATDRLYLVNASGLPSFRQVFDAFSTMGFYNLNPDRIRDLQSPDSGTLLFRDGSNLTSVLRQIGESDPERKQRIEEYLAHVVPGVRGVDVKIIGPKETLEFKQEVKGAKDPWRFLAANMSDGTVRALGIVLALLQARGSAPLPVRLVGIEEPEVALHPAAAGALMDALREAADSTQVIVTTHSPDLIDAVDLNRELLIAVSAAKGDTYIGPVDQASKEILRKGLYSPGELLRLGQYEPDVTLFEKLRNRLPLFDGVGN